MKKRVLFLLLTLLVISVVALGVSGCKAWRTVSTSATYVQQTDSAGRNSATISTKTVEEYQGVKKR